MHLQDCRIWIGKLAKYFQDSRPIVICSECKYWDNSTRYTTMDSDDPYGLCKSNKFNYAEHNPGETDNLVYNDYEGYAAGFETGKNFGCIHGVKK